MNDMLIISKNGFTPGEPITSPKFIELYFGLMIAQVRDFVTIDDWLIDKNTVVPDSILTISSNTTIIRDDNDTRPSIRIFFFSFDTQSNAHSH